MKQKSDDNIFPSRFILDIKNNSILFDAFDITGPLLF